MEPFNNVRAWEKDSDAPVCRKCRVEFGWSNWRHHCRSCGRVLCDVCSCHYVLIPYDELCPNAPTFVNLKEPQRACWDCAERIRARQRRENDQIIQHYLQMQDHEVAGVRDGYHGGLPIANAIDYDRHLPSKLYHVRLPSNLNLNRERIIGVDLGGRVCHVRVPSGIRPGDSFHVRANGSRVISQAPDDVFTEVYIVNIDTLNDIINEQNEAFYSTTGSSATTSSPSGGTNASPPRSRPSASMTEPPLAAATILGPALPSAGGHSNSTGPSTQVEAETVPEDAFIECQACTYHNLLRATECGMCGGALYQ